MNNGDLAINSKLNNYNISKLDRIDKILLYFLSSNSRMKLSKIAKILKTSPARVAYHFNNLIKNNIILYFLTLIDYRKLGYNCYSIYYRINDISQKEKERIIKEISKISNVADIIDIDGVYNFHVAILEKNLLKSAESIWRLREILSNVLMEEVILIYISAEMFERKMFKLDSVPTQEKKAITVVKEPDEIIELNQKEKKILAVIANNANVPTIELAKKVSLSPSLVQATIKNLEKKQIIKGYTIKINSQLQNYLYYRVMVKLKNISKKKRDEIMNFLEEHELIYRSTLTFGSYDLIYDVRASNLEELKSLIQFIYEKYQNEIIKQDWIKIYNIIKYTFYNDEST